MGLYHLLTFWQGEEVDPEIRTKICDEEISEEEEVKMFLEWCQTDYSLRNMKTETKQELRNLLKKNPSFAVNGTDSEAFKTQNIS